MRILLSPLLLCTRFCRLCVRRHYRERPGDWIWLYELERMPPLGSFEAGRGFTPDLSLFLMFDEFVIDGVAHERIMGDSPPVWLRQWPQVLRMLEAEGALATVDTDREVKKAAPIRGAMMRRDMAAPARWSSAMAYYDNIMTGALTAFEDTVAGSTSFSWGFDPDNESLVKGPDRHLHRLAGVLRTGPVGDQADPHFELYKQSLSSLRMQLGEVNAGLAVTHSLSAAPMLWAPYDKYVKEKLADRPAVLEAHGSAEAARLFFRVAFPKYRPESISDLGRLRRDKGLKRLRQEIAGASQTGEVLDPQYPQRVLEHVLKVERRAARVRTISGWLSSLVGIVPVPGLSLAAAAVAEVVSRKVEGRLRRQWDWFYLISNGIGGT